MIKSYKYRLYPTLVQSVLIDKHIGASRFVYNLALEVKHNSFFRYSTKLNCKDLSAQLTDLKKQELWLNDICAQSLQFALRKLDNAFTNFFNHNSDYPKFKSKRKSKQSCHWPQSNKLDLHNNLLQIIKFPEGIKIKLDKRIPIGQIKSVCISKTPTGKYFASINFETEDIKAEKKPIDFDTAIGVDLGVTHFATLSSGIKIENPRFFVKSQDRLRILQQRLSKKKKGSNRYKKQQHKINLIHEKITNQRQDFLHKLSNQITNDYDTICIENLNIAGMLKNHSLAKHISDVAWGKFIQFVEYKVDWRNKNILQIGRFEPSSKLCECGKINRELKLSDRVWTCSCGRVHDRDVLAANNIKRMAFRNINSSEGIAGVNVELPTLVGAMKR